MEHKNFNILLITKITRVHAKTTRQIKTLNIKKIHSALPLLNVYVHCWIETE